MDVAYVSFSKYCTRVQMIPFQRVEIRAGKEDCRVGGKTGWTVRIEG